MMKKVLFITTILFALPLLSLAQGNLKGDVNNDGFVTISDVTTLIDYLLSGDSSCINLTNADVNPDNHVSISDVTALIDVLLSGNTNPDTGSDLPGLYMGITGFNNQLYTKSFLLLNRNTKGDFTGFVSSLSTQNATVLYYAVDKSLDALNAAPFPQNLRNVAIVTFTDGLDQGSLMLTDQGYLSDTEYASALSSRIQNMTVHACPLQAYSIGLKGSDVTNNAMFMSNLQSLASSDENVALVNNMDEVTAKFQDIANSLAKTSYSYSHSMTLTIPGISDGTRIRFTFDDVNNTNVAQSQRYIEGTFNLGNCDLTNVTYKGMVCSSGTSIRPKFVNGVFVTYEFEGLVLSDPSERINKNTIQEWYWIADNSRWQINSEFTPLSIDDVDVEVSYTSAIVMLVLDCSSSLSSDFITLKSAANKFINTLADYDSYNPQVEVQGRTYTVNGVPFRMVQVDGGSFTMGATGEQGSDANSNETPLHQVSLPDYFIGQTEVTQELWKAVMGSNPSSFSDDLNRPVENVSWNDCQTFISKLNKLTGETFRLPTEAEWEYAARGGKYALGYKFSGGNSIGDVAWYTSNSSNKTQAVATKEANELGLYDMSGNVNEWCHDWYGNYSSVDQTMPMGPSSGSYRVLRGGSWYDPATSCRVSCRNNSSPSTRSRYNGLRLALYDYSSFEHLSLSETDLNMIVGDNQSISVSGGSGYYDVQSTSILSVTVDGSVVRLMAKTPGTTVITITDSFTREKACASVHVSLASSVAIDTIVPGMYMGITGFNEHLYNKSISLLNRITESKFTGFVNSLPNRDGTLLYYAVDKSLDSLAEAPCPRNLRNVAIVTFTDGLDQGSLMLTERGFTHDTQYASAMGERINEMVVHGCTLQAFSIGLKGNDVIDNSMFIANLRSLASSDDNVALVNDMDEVTAKFNEIANNLAQKSYSYSHTLTLTIPGISNGTRIRFTFDDVTNNSVSQSTQYIEGTFNLIDRSLTNVTYHGLTSTSGTTIMPKSVNVPYITYEFDDLVLTDPSQQIDKNKIKEWYWVADYGWQINSEFTPSSIDDMQVETSYSSAIVMLVLDCSSSLIDDFSQLKSAANTFIDILADYDSFSPFALSESELSLVVGNQTSVNIMNGSGCFSVSGGDDIVTARIEGNNLLLEGLKSGTTSLIVTDIATQTTQHIVVNVISPVTLSQSEVSMSVGCQYSIDVLSGSGNYSVTGGDSIVSARFSGSKLILNGLNEGAATLTITDVTTQMSIYLSVIVYNPIGLSQSVLSLHVGDMTSVDILNGSGNFTVSGGDSIVAAQLTGRDLVLTGLNIGTATLVITDVITQTTFNLSVYVYGFEQIGDVMTYNINGVSFDMVMVEGGTFTMGGTPEQGEYVDNDELPVHQVSLSNYSIGKTEVTQELWVAVMGTNPSYFSSSNEYHAYEDCLQRPVENFSWEDGQLFIEKLNQITGMVFRLPTEAEWEFAARGGNISRGYMFAGSDEIDVVAWYIDNAGSHVGNDSPDFGSHSVGLKAPNELGLYDMSGNVYEFCSDWYGKYTSDPQINPIGPDTGTRRVIRGGAWSTYGDYYYVNCRVSARFAVGQNHCDNSVGLRLAL